MGKMRANILGEILGEMVDTFHFDSVDNAKWGKTEA
jgi:hypothetical protein